MKQGDDEPRPVLSVVKQLAHWKPILSGTCRAHGNSTLELFDVLVVLLAAFYNPTARSLRLIEALSQSAWVRQQTGVGRVPRSTLSDNLTKFDPSPLKPLIAELLAKIPAVTRRDPELSRVSRQILATDGSEFQLAGEAAWTLLSTRRDGRPLSTARLDLQLDVERFCPVEVDVSGNEEGFESHAVAKRVRPGVIYVADRNYVNYHFMNRVFEAGSNLVVRLKQGVIFRVEAARPLTAGDAAAGVVADETGHVGSEDPGRSRYLSDLPPRQSLRRVRVNVRTRDGTEQAVDLLTDLSDLPAETIAYLYRLRWQIELFFRWLKVWARMDHCLNFSARGLTTQFYAAVIGTLLLHLHTGRRVSKYHLFALQLIHSGQGTMEGLAPWLGRVETEKENERKRLEKKRNAKAAQ